MISLSQTLIKKKHLFIKIITLRFYKFYKYIFCYSTVSNRNDRIGGWRWLGLGRGFGRGRRWRPCLQEPPQLSECGMSPRWRPGHAPRAEVPAQMLLRWRLQEQEEKMSLWWRMRYELHQTRLVTVLIL